MDPEEKGDRLLHKIVSIVNSCSLIKNQAHSQVHGS